MDEKETELDFYSRFTKPLIIALNDSKDRSLAAGWVLKIRDENSGPEQLRASYIKLLLFALQRGHLSGIFADNPSNYESLEPIPDEYDLNDLAKIMIENEIKAREDKIQDQIKGKPGRNPPYTTDCSSDFRQYVAAQDIPNFGIHCYYAISREPIQKWRQAEKGIYPPVAKSTVDIEHPLPPEIKEQTAAQCICQPTDETAPSACKDRANKEKQQKKNLKLGKHPPCPPLGRIPPEEDERVPPKWGSYLVEVQQKPEYEPENTDAGKGSDGSPCVCADDGDDNEGMFLDLSDIGHFVKEYKMNMMGKKAPSFKGKTTSTPKKSPLAVSFKSTGPSDDEEEDSEDEEAPCSKASLRDEEIHEDARALYYLRKKLGSSAASDWVALAQHGAAALPVRGGIPLTTPRMSPSPRRTGSSERLYAEEPEEMPSQFPPPPMCPPMAKSSYFCMKDEGFSAMYDAAAEAALDNGDFIPSDEEEDME